MCWAACETYWFALWGMSYFLCHKIINTKRVYRRRHRLQDLEVGYSPDDRSDFSETHRRLSHSRKRKSSRHNHLRRTISSSNIHDRHHHLKLKARQVSFRVRGGSSRHKNSRHQQSKKLRWEHREARKIKRRRLW